MQAPDTHQSVESADFESVSIARLRSELESDTEESDVGDLVDGIEDVDDDFSFETPYVKGSLDEILLALVALRSTDTHGKKLIEDLEEFFDTSVSPGTVYPRLHELCETGALNRHELVRTKEYRIRDEEAITHRLSEAANQHLAMGMILQAALETEDLE